MGVMKKTVVIHPIIDSYIRKTWAILIDCGKGASYSSALNFMLLTAIFEALKEEGINENTRKLIWGFMKNQEVIKELDHENLLIKFEQTIKPQVPPRE